MKNERRHCALWIFKLCQRRYITHQTMLYNHRKDRKCHHQKCKSAPQNVNSFLGTRHLRRIRFLVVTYISRKRIACLCHFYSLVFALNVFTSMQKDQYRIKRQNSTYINANKCTEYHHSDFFQTASFLLSMGFNQ